MPIYEYECEKCGHEFEREQRITDDPVKTCPKCRSRKVKRLISQTSFVLKGGGWYNDLYASNKKGKAADKEAGGDKAADTDKKDKKEKPAGAAAKADKGKKTGGDGPGKGGGKGKSAA